jgi:hypothetical protein
MLVIENKNAGHARPLYEKMTLDSWPAGRGIPACHRSGPANDNSRTHGKLGQYRIADGSRSVVEIDVDTARTRPD